MKLINWEDVKALVCYIVISTLGATLALAIIVAIFYLGILIGDTSL